MSVCRHELEGVQRPPNPSAIPTPHEIVTSNVVNDLVIGIASLNLFSKTNGNCFRSNCHKVSLLVDRCIGVMFMDKFRSAVVDHTIHDADVGRVRSRRHGRPHRVGTLVVDYHGADRELLLEFGACLCQRLLHRDLLQLTLLDDRPRQLHLRLDSNGVDCLHHTATQTFQQTL